MTEFTFKKAERLKSHKTIERLFAEGKSFATYPLRLIWIETEQEQEFPIQFALTVSKKRFNKAVERNRIRRLMRESYRLNKHRLYDELKSHKKNYALMFLYVGDKEQSFKSIEKATQKAIRRFLRETEVLK